VEWELKQFTLEMEKAVHWHWSRQPAGSISFPDFIQKRANGEAKMDNGVVYLKKPGPDPELVTLLNAKMNEATKALSDAKDLYERAEDDIGILKGKK
jgi:hypothetical protein